MQEALRELEGLTSIAKPINHVRVALRAGPAERVHFVMSVNSPNGPSSVAILQYLVLNKGNVYTLTFTTLASQEARYEPTFEAIAQSFRLLEK